jgi:hypothetical protein
VPCSSARQNTGTSTTSPVPPTVCPDLGAWTVTLHPSRTRSGHPWSGWWDAITGAVAFVRDEMQDIVAVNDLGREFYRPVLGEKDASGAQSGRANLARFQFLDPASREFYPDWDTMARMCVGVMHAEVGRNPGHRGLQDLVGELSTLSADFAELWAAHDVRIHGAGTKRFHHPEVGELTLAFEELQVTADDGLALYVYSAEPGSASEEKLRLLASLAATTDIHPS